MKTYKVVRRGATAETPEEAIRIWDGEQLLWERDASSYIEHDGKMVKLSDLGDTEIIDLYRKEHD